MIFFISWLILVLFSILKNKDLFSPAKFYLLNIGIYFAKIFIKEYSIYINLIYAILLFIGFFLIVFEPKYNIGKMSQQNKEKLPLKYHTSIWLLSMIPIMAQMILIKQSGGLGDYINNIGQRVVLWRGKGHILEAIKLFSILNLIYFGIILNNSKLKIEKLLYLFHFVLFIIIGLLSGSRGGLLWNFVYMTILYNYLKKAVKIKRVVFIGIICLFLASILGIARNGYKYSSEYGLKTGLSKSDSKLETKHFEYGINPLEIVFDKNIKELEYGKTYMTVFTNLVPRKIWENKPDTGGLIFTKKYTNDQWGGYSNLATGVIVEGMINFGIELGLIFSIVQLSVCLSYTLYEYKKKILLKKENNLKRIIGIIIYIYIVTSLPGLVKGEWTNVILDLVLKIIKINIIYIFLKKGEKSNEKR